MDRLYIIWTPTYAKSRFNILQYYMFHGKCSRDAAGNIRTPLALIRNGRLIPDVFCPGLTMVVSERVRRCIEQIPGIAFRDVIFEKLVDFDYQVGDFSYFNTTEYRANPEREDPEMLIERLPDVKSFHESVGRNFELVIPSYEDIRTSHMGDNELTVRIPEAKEHVFLSEPFAVTRRMIENTPIFRNGEFFVNGQFLDYTRDFLDRDFFRVEEVLTNPRRGRRARKWW